MTRLIRGDTFPIVLTSFRMKSAIRVTADEIAAVACAAINGVANPNVHAASNAHVISFPTSSATMSRTISRTKPTTVPMIITPVEIPSANAAAPASASACTAPDRR
ncbi:hypothetical protein [Amycolatopsis thermalba]|uniref:hypothetical protein n=1 Tax=Amycolatopsis thermalba TaxID=944492 RepID=UPI001FC99506|nr:hypothetical protein [Amycolatopsis thermalba]